jgi:hypothetical protein
MKCNQLKGNLSLRAAFAPLAMLLGVMLAAPAFAEDGKEYPGSMCREGVDGFHQKRASGDVVFYLEGTALNISTTSSRYITCPLVRDAEAPRGNITYAAVSVYKPSSTSVICQLQSNPYFGGAGWFTSKIDSSTATGLRLIELPVRADNFTSGSFNLWCLAPKTVAGQKSGIYHYGIVEAE